MSEEMRRLKEERDHALANAQRLLTKCQELQSHIECIRRDCLEANRRMKDAEHRLWKEKAKTAALVDATEVLKDTKKMVHKDAYIHDRAGRLTVLAGAALSTMSNENTPSWKARQAVQLAVHIDALIMERLKFEMEEAEGDDDCGSDEVGPEDVGHCEKEDNRAREAIVLEEALRALEAGEDSTGFCIVCLTEHSGIEPDASNYECENCARDEVFGAEEIVVMYGV